MKGKNVLILNTDMMPITLPYGTVPPDAAVRRVLAGFRADKDDTGCRVVYSFKHRILTQVPLDDFDLGCWPSVIVRNKFLKRSNKVAYSRNNVYARDEGKCRYCNAKLLRSEAELEHYIPRSKDGKTDFENIVIACKACNSAKDNQMPKGRWKLDRLPHVPDFWEIVHKKTFFPITIPDERWLEFIPKWNAEVTIVE